MLFRSHIGAPATPKVSVGDQVYVGQIIGEANGFISANICSSVSGKVIAIEPRLTVSGNKSLAVIIENDNEYKGIKGFGKAIDWKQLSPDEIRYRIKEAGIVGMGGAGFPTHVKLTPKDSDAIDYVLVNGAECEPYLTSDYRMMLEGPEYLVEGLKVILKLFPNARGVIAVEDNKPDCIEVLSHIVEHEEKISVQVLKTKYPQGAERQLISAVTGRKINSSMLPADAGVVVNNVDTVMSIYLAVCMGIPLIRRIITVTGTAIAKPQNYNVPTGINYQEVIEAAGGFAEPPDRKSVV